jgi:hypothetical protein
LPAARYVYPAVIPAMLVFIAGWVQLLDLSLGTWLGHNRPGCPSGIVYLPLGFFFLGLNIYCLISMVGFWQAAGVL